MEKIYILPENDAESVAIIDMLKKAGYKENENLFITKQGWGASWDSLEQNIKDVIGKTQTKTEIKKEAPTSLKDHVKWEVHDYHLISNGYGGARSEWHHNYVLKGTYKDYLTNPYGKYNKDIHSRKGMRGNAGGVKVDPAFVEKEYTVTLPAYQIFGVELQGEAPAGATNIDHHVYDGDDRNNPLSSIEQVSNMLKIDLSLRDQFIAANDKGYIPAMEKLANNLNMTEELKNEVIQLIRRLDRNAQGITPEQEQEAEEAIKNKITKDELTVVELPHSKCATITDRLYGQYKNLLIKCGDGEINFYGNGSICQQLQQQFKGWSGGQLPETGFWGGYADHKTVETAIEAMLKKQKTQKINARPVLESLKESINNAIQRLASKENEIKTNARADR